MPPSHSYSRVKNENGENKGAEAESLRGNGARTFVDEVRIRAHREGDKIRPSHLENEETNSAL